MKFRLGFYNSSGTIQEWMLFFNNVTIQKLSLNPNHNSNKYYTLELGDDNMFSVTVTTAEQYAAAVLTYTGDKLQLLSYTHWEWALEQETNDEYILNCKLN